MKFIHICGASAVGKRTLKDQIKIKNPTILQQFGINDEFTIYGPVSEGEAQKKDIDVITLGDNVKEAILNNTYPIAIHHWQGISDNLIEDVKNKFPNAEHKIILLWRDPVKHIQAGEKREQDNKDNEMYKKDKYPKTVEEIKNVYLHWKSILEAKNCPIDIVKNNENNEKIDGQYRYTYESPNW